MLRASPRATEAIAWLKKMTLGVGSSGGVAQVAGGAFGGGQVEFAGRGGRVVPRQAQRAGPAGRDGGVEAIAEYVLALESTGGLARTIFQPQALARRVSPASGLG